MLNARKGIKLIKTQEFISTTFKRNDICTYIYKYIYIYIYNIDHLHRSF